MDLRMRESMLDAIRMIGEMAPLDLLRDYISLYEDVLGLLNDAVNNRRIREVLEDAGLAPKVVPPADGSANPEGDGESVCG